MDSSTNDMFRPLDRLHAGTPEYRERVQSAESIVQDALQTAKGRAYVSWSTGKDSTALLHLVTQTLGIDIPAVYFDADAKLPDTQAYVSRFLNRYDVQVRVVETESMMNVFERVGGPTTDGVENETMQATVWRPVAQLEREGWRLAFVGMRAEESRNRARQFRKHGAIRIRSQGATAYPLKDWRAEDVWAYLAEHDVPVHPAYARTDYLDRDEIRTSYWCGESGVQFGRWYWLKQEYPSLYNRFAERFPEVRQTG